MLGDYGKANKKPPTLNRNAIDRKRFRFSISFSFAILVPAYSLWIATSKRSNILNYCCSIFTIDREFDSLCAVLHCAVYYLRAHIVIVDAVRKTNICTFTQIILTQQASLSFVIDEFFLSIWNVVFRFGSIYQQCTASSVMFIIIFCGNIVVGTMTICTHTLSFSVKSLSLCSVKSSISHKINGFVEQLFQWNLLFEIPSNWVAVCVCVQCACPYRTSKYQQPI